MANNRELSQFGAFVEVDNSTLGITTSVGINKTSPQYTLDVNGDINFTGIFYQGGSQFIASRWSATGSDIYRLSKVGINTSSPQADLDVGGDALINGLTVGLGSGDVSSNTAVGYQALLSNTTGYDNVANGYQALYSNTTGYNNVANGLNALYSNTTGYDNVATGLQALFSNTTGVQNTAVGRNSGYDNTTGSNNTFIGYDAQPSSATVSNEVTIGDTNVDTIRVPGVGFYAVRTNTTVATTSATTIDSIPTATYRSARVQIQITQGTDYQVSDVLIIHDGTTTSIVEYGSIATNAYLCTFSGALSGGNALLQVNMGSATSSTVKVLSYRTIL